MKRWIATYTDYGDTCDGKSRTLGVFKTKEEAQAAVHTDIERWANKRTGMPIVIDFDKMSAKYDWKTLDDRDGCEWNIEECEVDPPNKMYDVTVSKILFLKNKPLCFDKSFKPTCLVEATSADEAIKKAISYVAKKYNEKEHLLHASVCYDVKERLVMK